MTKINLTIMLTVSILLNACSQSNTNNKDGDVSAAPTEKATVNFKLADFYSDNIQLIELTEAKFNLLTDEQKVAQLLMPAVGEHGQKKELIERLTKEGKIGGVLMLNGTKSEFKTWISEFNNLNDSLGYLPFLYSADAEPSLINRKIKNTPVIQKANTLKTLEEVKKCAADISKELNEIGINYNFAPVVDMSPNKTVGWRSFGHMPDSVIPWSAAFINTSQEQNIIATAKHFPGHGFVTGDTHKKLVYINGEMKEVKNYPYLIENNVMSIMVAHIAITNNNQYNTNDMPSTTSEKIVTHLLRDSLNFQGLIVTDAMNMGGVSSIKNAEVLAIKAGCDIILMPLNAEQAHKNILAEYHANLEFKDKVDLACKRVIRAKLSLGLLNTNE